MERKVKISGCPPTSFTSNCVICFCFDWDMCTMGPQKKQVKQRILFTTQRSLKANSTTWTKTSACMVVNEHGLTTLKPTTIPKLLVDGKERWFSDFVFLPTTNHLWPSQRTASTPKQTQHACFISQTSLWTSPAGPTQVTRPEASSVTSSVWVKVREVTLLEIVEIYTD